MIRYAIIDDEPIAHRIIEGYCRDLPHLQKAGNCYNAFEAIELLNNTVINLLFLDINMPQLSGFDFLKTLPHPPKTIVTSAHKEFALEGYELNISDYLLKPFSFERLLKAVNKAMDANTANTTPTTVFPPVSRALRFFIKGDKKQHQVVSTDILYIEAYGNYCKIYLKEEMILSHEMLSFFEGLLPNSGFLRVHKSFIVALDKIKWLEGNRLVIGKHKIPLGQTYRNGVKKRLNL